jgi:hypothetical protein
VKAERGGRTGKARTTANADSLRERQTKKNWVGG